MIQMLGWSLLRRPPLVVWGDVQRTWRQTANCEARTKQKQPNLCKTQKFHNITFKNYKKDPKSQKSHGLNSKLKNKDHANTLNL